ncbi:MAG: T9SS type A sorting domain-containing protein, partial [Bacteroidota bacterium]|nr:T9SS type A sorting domain-containing protein [Bacteroidota bacterium]
TRWDFTAYVRDTLRRLPMHVTAHVSEEYAVAVAHIMEIPALFPVIAASVEGPDTLSYDPDSLYAPNPFTRTLRIHNSGTADLQLDSVRLSWDDSLMRAESATVWTAGAVVPPDSVFTLSFTLRAESHVQEKTVGLDFVLHHGGGKSDMIAASVYLPALRPGLDAVVLGNAQLLTDPISIYRPDPFTKTVRVSNSGTADLQLDSIIVSFTDPAISVIGATTRVLATVIAVGDSRESEWEFRAEPHASSGYAAIRFLLYHSGGEMLPLQTEIFIPGEPFSFTLEDVNIPDRLIARGDGQGYENNPVAISFRAENAAWFASSLRLLRVRVEGEGAEMLTTQPRTPAIDLNPYATSPVVRDSFFVFPATYDRVIRVYLQVESSRGLGDSTRVDIFVPRVTTTAVGTVPVPSGLALTGLYPNPVSLRGAAYLNAAVRSSTPYRWAVYDLLGRLCASSVALPPSDGSRFARIPLHALSQGNYLLRVMTAEEQITARFMILD